MSNSGFVFLRSYYDALRPLPDAERLALLDSILDFAFEGTEPENLSPLLNGFFVLLRPNIESGLKRYRAAVTNGQNGGRPPKAKDNPAETEQKPSKNPMKIQTKPSGKLDKEKDKDFDSDSERESIPAVKPPRPRFAPPNVDDVQAYCLERKNGIDPAAFVDYYTVRGWKLNGGQTMRDWRAAIRTWERRNRPQQTDRNRLRTDVDYRDDNDFFGGGN